MSFPVVNFYLFLYSRLRFPPPVFNTHRCSTTIKSCLQEDNYLSYTPMFYYSCTILPRTCLYLQHTYQFIFHTYDKLRMVLEEGLMVYSLDLCQDCLIWLNPELSSIISRGACRAWLIFLLLTCMYFSLYHRTQIQY